MILLLSMVLLFEGFVVYKDYFQNITNSITRDHTALAEYATEVIAKCASVSYKPTCYDKEIPKLMDSISMEDAFKVTSLVQQQVTDYPYCHVLGHELSAREVDKNPSKWKEVLTRCPGGLCSNGCIHGGLQERFRAETFTDDEVAKLMPDLESLCESRPDWNPTGLEQSSCYHALGHLTMYVTNADINKATGICEIIAKKSDGRNFVHICFDGAYMQIFQPLEPEDFALIEGKEVKKDQLVAFCNKFTGERKGSCWSEGWPLFRAELQQPAGLVKYCSQAEIKEQSRCYDALVYVLTAQFGLDVEKVKSYCPGLPADRSPRCFADAASRMIETDYRNAGKSVQICQFAGPYDKNDVCFRELLTYSQFNFHKDSDEFNAMCSALPELWRDKCFNGDRS